MPVAAVGDDTSLPEVMPKMKISPARYLQLQEKNPRLYTLINKVAAQVGIRPIELANLVYVESANDPTFQDGDRVGYTGVTQQDADKYDPHHQFNIHDPIDNLYLGAFKYKVMSHLYGRRTASSIMAYHHGEGHVNSLSRMHPRDQQVHGAQAFAYLHHFVNGGMDNKALKE